MFYLYKGKKTRAISDMEISPAKTYSRWQILQIGGINDIMFDLSTHLGYNSPSESSCDFVHGWLEKIGLCPFQKNNPAFFLISQTN